MADIWFYCSDCGRWYYSPPSASDRCPVCESEPSAAEDRAARSGERVAAPLVGSAQS